MIRIITNQLGGVYHAAQHPDLQQTRPCYCFIPESFFEETGFQKSRYLVSRWPSINCSANPLAVGSHVLPDLKKPVDLNSQCPILVNFLARLETIAAVKTITEP